MLRTRHRHTVQCLDGCVIHTRHRELLKLPIHTSLGEVPTGGLFSIASIELDSNVVIMLGQFTHSASDVAIGHYA